MNEFYQLITYNEYRQAFETRQEFENHEKIKISSQKRDCLNEPNGCIVFNFIHRKYRISKQRDEWYYVQLLLHEVYYKCDQLEGLIKLLSDIENGVV